MVATTIGNAVGRRMKERQLDQIRDEIQRELRLRHEGDLTPYLRYVELVKAEWRLIDELEVLRLGHSVQHAPPRVVHLQ